MEGLLVSVCSVGMYLPDASSPFGAPISVLPDRILCRRQAGLLEVLASHPHPKEKSVALARCPHAPIHKVNL